MKQIRFIPIIAVLIMLSCSTPKSPDSDNKSLMDASRQELVTALDERDRLLALVKDISTSMEQIKRLEHIISVGDARPSENPRRYAAILADISTIKKTLKERREQLATLESSLRESALCTDELLDAISLLRNQIESQTTEIESMQKQLSSARRHIESLNTTVDSLNTTVENVNHELDAAIAESTDLENELNLCFYVAASRSELKQHKIIETSFLRKSRLMKGDFDRGVFITADKRYLDSIPLASSKAKILTTHPADSYEIKRDGSTAVLHILAPDSFWMLSNYLVVETY